jgi:hypothetical protein
VDEANNLDIEANNFDIEVNNLDIEANNFDSMFFCLRIVGQGQQEAAIFYTNT